MHEGYDTSERFTQGLALRREVLGDAHVGRSLDSARGDDFLRPMQQLTTEFGWGTIWSRPGLERKTRSLLSVALLAALGREHELRAHVRGAVRNGATREEIREALVHTALYCGFPAGLEGARVARDVLSELEAQEG